ncbi:hypothetical protein [Flavobacterium sp.]|uniref:hypothetical protein n=1 Tax=Flavobacterium sp. TaxID=239 RepID=UPI0025E74579|nr:hypothetical protein [Flavobacterium sp.]
MITQTKSTGKFSTYLAITSFGIGTLLLILYLLFPETMLLIYAGYFYVLLAILINGITFLHLFYLFIIYRLKREIIAIRMLILLANIPIALFYLNIVIHTTN